MTTDQTADPLTAIASDYAVRHGRQSARMELALRHLKRGIAQPELLADMADLAISLLAAGDEAP